VHVVAPHKGAILGAGRKPDELTVDRSFLTACAAEADAVIVANGTTPLASIPSVVTYVQEAYRHHKTVAAVGDGVRVLEVAGIPTSEAGVLVTAKTGRAFSKTFLSLLGLHRHWERGPMEFAGKAASTMIGEGV
jgi:catalase